MPGSGDRKRTGNKSRAMRGEKKRHYLQQARLLFAQFGYVGTSFEQIVEAAGVSRSVLMKSFPDKAALLTALGDEWLETLFPPPAADETIPADIITRLHAFSDRFLAILRKDHPTARILLSGLAEPIEAEESSILHAIMQAAIDRLTPILQEGQQAGVIRRGIDARRTAADWLRFVLGAALLPPAAIKEGEVPTQIIETLLHGVLKTDV